MIATPCIQVTAALKLKYNGQKVSINDLNLTNYAYKKYRIKIYD